jgi:uncharacterized protein YbjT (DUF2867 family)
MKIVVIGGNGFIGSKLVPKLRDLSHDVVSVSRRNGVDVFTGEGLGAAIRDSAVVVDLTNSPSFEEHVATEFFKVSGQNISTAEKSAGVSHHIVLSIVGSERPSSLSYLQAKALQEKMVSSSGVPYSIIRSTQFFEFIPPIAQAGIRGNEIHPTPALVQPIASDDVVNILIDQISAPPVNGSIEIAGPQKLGLNEFIRMLLHATDDARELVINNLAGYFGVEITDDTLTPLDHATLGNTEFIQWLDSSKSKGLLKPIPQ